MFKTTRPYATLLTLHIVLASCMALTTIPYAQAQIIPEDPGLFAEDVCDAGYAESIKSKAWLEAQREVIQHQNLIFKPDSVLEYTCFDSSLNQLVLSAETRPLFSMNDRWEEALGDGINPIGDLLGEFSAFGDMQAALTPLAVANAAYDRTEDEELGNFEHDLLGGRWVNESYDISNAVAAEPYACDRMDRVWEQAKCMSFINTEDALDDEDNDAFFTFRQYVESPDKRFLPEPCEPLDEETPIQDQILENYGIALIPEEGIGGFPTFTPWIEDDINTYYWAIYPLEEPCGIETSIIGTSLSVRVSPDVNEYYEEHVCLVPGCTYNPPGGGEGIGECVLP